MYSGLDLYYIHIYIYIHSTDRDSKNGFVPVFFLALQSFAEAAEAIEVLISNR